MIIRLNLSEGNFFFPAIKSFDANIAISGNFAFNAKNSTVMIKQFGKTNELFAARQQMSEMVLE